MVFVVEEVAEETEGFVELAGEEVEEGDGYCIECDPDW